MPGDHGRRSMKEVTGGGDNGLESAVDVELVLQ
jgi:hypothetical protein